MMIGNLSTSLTKPTLPTLVDIEREGTSCSPWPAFTPSTKPARLPSNRPRRQPRRCPLRNRATHPRSLNWVKSLP